jgi:hypothetical protein
MKFIEENYMKIPRFPSAHEMKNVFFYRGMVLTLFNCPNKNDECLNDYGKDIIGLLAEKQICLDGKKLKKRINQKVQRKGWCHKNTLSLRAVLFTGNYTQ